MSHKPLERVDVAGIGFDPITQDQLIDDIARHIDSRKTSRSFTIMKPYVEFFIKAWSDSEIMQILQRADRVVADGIAVQWAASYLSGSKGFIAWLKSLLINIQDTHWREQIIPERGAGVDATDKLLRRASQEGWSVGIFGGPDDTDHTQQAVRDLYPKLKLIDVWSGYYNPTEEAQIINKIKSAKLDILFVAQGFPRQEKFIDRYAVKGIARVLIGEGGTFDFDSMGGDIKRAPSWMRQAGLEWLWRLVQQPSRWRRQLALPIFVWRIYRFGQQN